MCFLKVQNANANELKKAKNDFHLAILKQNKLIFEGFSFYQKQQFFIFEDCLFACFYGYLQTREFYEKPAPKPCKIPIKPKTRNKDNI